MKLFFFAFNLFQILHQEFSGSAHCLSLVETLSTICHQNPHYAYCPSSEYGEQAPTAKQIRRAPEQSKQLTNPLNFGRSVGNEASINLPGLGAIDVNTGSSDIAKFLPGRATDTDNSEASQINSDETSGLGRTRHGLLSLAGLGTFDIRKQVGNGAGFSNLFSELFPSTLPLLDQVQPFTDHVKRKPSANERNFPQLSDEMSTSKINGAATQTSEEQSSAEQTSEPEQGFISQQGFENLPPRFLPLTSEQISANRPLTSLADLGLKKDEMTDLCRKFSTIAAQHCYKPKIEIEFLDKCRGYNADCATYIEQSRPLGAVANAFRSSVGATAYDWGVKGIPYYVLNEEGSIRNGLHGKADFGSYGGGYSQDMSVTDFWAQKAESGANWYEGIYGQKTGWKVPIGDKFGVEGGGATHIHIPLKEGEFGKPVGLTNGYHVGPYVGFAETVGMDWMNGGVSTRRAVGLPIVGVNASSGSSIAFPGLSSFMSKTGLGDALNAMG